MAGVAPVSSVELRAAPHARLAEILAPPARAFLAELHRRFDGRRRDLLAARAERQKGFDAGELPDFAPETLTIREEDWLVAPIPADLLDRRVEIAGPVDRKTIVDALNSGANVFVADFEDACSPTFANLIDGQASLKDRWQDRLDFVDPATAELHALKPDPAALMVRPRGWHIEDRRLRVDGAAISGALFDFGLYVFHCAKTQMAKGATPALYLAKLEGRGEARLWSDVFAFAEGALDLPAGAFKATALIETLPAAFEMEEILYALRGRALGLGLGCARWNAIFSLIKRLGENPAFLTPDRAAMTMGKAFLDACSLLLIKTCHRRGAFAIGGMAAQIPITDDPAANDAAFANVKADKEREAANGFDGAWIAHPDLVPAAREAFARLAEGPNQLAVLRKDVKATRDDLLKVHDGPRTESALRENICVGVQYIEAWLRGRGAVPLHNLMEDAATAEAARAQAWQWLHLKAKLDDGRAVTPMLFRAALGDEIAKLREALGEAAFARRRFAEASELFATLSLSDGCEEFLTPPAYRLID
jgi:malate synthase